MKFDFNVTLQDLVTGAVFDIHPTVQFYHTPTDCADRYHATLSNGGCEIRTMICRRKTIHPHELPYHAENIIRDYWTSNHRSFEIISLEPCY